MAVRSFFFIVGIATLVMLIFMVGCDTRHTTMIYKTKKHHIVMQDDKGTWWVYTVDNSSDIISNVPYNTRGEMVLPPGGWRAATQQEEEEVTTEGEATNAEATTVDETDTGAPDGGGDVGGDSGGDSSGGGDAEGGDGGGDSE